MKSCRVCKESKTDDLFAIRGLTKVTNCCIECSNLRSHTDYCEHGTRYHDCRKCVDGRLISARLTLHTSRTRDKTKKMDNDLDFQHLNDLFFRNDKCYYCEVELQHEFPYISNFATLERLDDSKGHTKENCVIACRYCNCSQKKHIHILKKILDAQKLIHQTGYRIALM
jgi:CO dehydrogenase/acetyl-CoA synthase alpha subunit